ncbi:hypothetical protein GCM10008904_07390 [Paraclostridium ghonii]|uniref:Protein phosphatase 2C n=1 Tax=Paraclostridium ghonii TaxID=29358 RepID=A0ABU0N2T3_9FIRM|nr:hypothetical protein [Paeniclostridium ghonii]MDQ0557474.1 hypothetical protein [Paeniclostridium ghonii]
MEIKVCDTLCYQGSAKYNEDIIGFNPFGAWVLDGATGLNKKNLISCKSDANWYVNWWNTYLHKNICEEITLKEIMTNGVKLIANEYYLKVDKDKIERLDTPSSSIAVIKFYDNKLEYFLLGDCSFHFKIDEEVFVIKDNSLCYLDRLVYNEMERLPNLVSLSFEEIKNSVMNTIISNRLKKNTKNGYWILDFDENAIENALNGFINVKDDINIMLTSDGFSCISDRYKNIEEYSLINEVQKHGVGHIYKKLRNIELDDFSTTRFPRFKVNDDSSCVYLEIDFN